MADSTARELRLVSWNVNGLRAVMKKDPSFTDVVEATGADVFAVQETKLQEGQIELDLPGYHQTWSYAERKGYSGTAVFSREEPLQVINHIGAPEADDEGRICALEFPSYWFVDVYTPNAQNELARIDTRLAWDAAYREFLVGLAAEKPVVTCGDFNVAHNEIDLKNPGPNRGELSLQRAQEQRRVAHRLLPRLKRHRRPRDRGVDPLRGLWLRPLPGGAHDRAVRAVAARGPHHLRNVRTSRPSRLARRTGPAETSGDPPVALA